MPLFPILLAAAATASATATSSATSSVEANAVTPVGRIVTVLHRDELAATGETDLAAALAALLPSFHFPAPFAVNAGGAGDDHVRVGTLRGLAPDQMVVLVNGQPQHTSALFYTSDMPGRGSVGFDLGLVPFSAVSRVEIMEGGASGRHGSGALAGVINIVLEDAPAGGRLGASFGQRRTTISGVPKLEGVVIEDGSLRLGRASERVVDDGDGDDLALMGDWGFALGNGGFVHLAAEYEDREATSRGGFDPRQQYPLRGDDSFDVRERTIDRLQTRYGDPEMTELDISLNAALPLSDRVTLYGFTALGTRDSESTAEFVRPVDPRNAPELYPDGFLPIVESDIDDRNFTIGFKGSHWGWNWDASYSQREDEIDWTVDGSLNPSFGGLSPTGFVTGNNEMQMRRIALEASRDLTVGFLAHPLWVEAGVESRSEEYEMERGELASYLDAGERDPAAGPVPAWSQGFFGYRDEVEGTRDLTAAYVSARNRLGRRVTLAAALRLDAYDGLDEQLSFDLGADVELSDALLLRAAGGLGFRAPSLAQTTYTRTRATATGAGPVLQGVFAPGSPVASALGVDELDEESAVHLSAGAVYTPVPALRLTIDAWQVDVDDRVVLSDELSGAAVTDALEQAGTDAAVFAARLAFNGSDVRVRGVDLGARYAMDLRSGRLDLHAAATRRWTDVSVHGTTSPLTGATFEPFGSLAAAQLEAEQPDSKLILGAAWARGPVDVRARLTRFGETEDLSFDAAGPLRIDPLWLLDLDVSFAVNRSVTFGVGVHNLLDEYPEVRSSGAGQPVANGLYPYSSYSPINGNGRLMYGRVSAVID